MAQVALSFLLVAAACLLVRSFWNLTHQDFGFEPQGVVMAELAGVSGMAFDATWGGNANVLSERLGDIPGVTSAGVTSSGILGQWSPFSAIDVATAERVTPASAGTRLIPVSARYIETLEVPILRGRSIGEQDGRGAPRVAVINETAARMLYGSADPIGRAFAPGSEFPSPSIFEVVGVVGDHVFDAPQQPIAPLAFVPLTQWPAGAPPKVFVRSASNRPPSEASLQAAVQDVLPAFMVGRVTSLEGLVRLAARREHLLAWLSAAVGGLALLLAAVGLYGVAAYSAKRRTHEIGIRMALGARASDIRRSVLRGSLAAAIAGLLIGLAATLVAARTLDAMLFGLSRNDPATLFAAACILLVVGTLAAYLPAERAARSDPLQSLRQE